MEFSAFFSPRQDNVHSAYTDTTQGRFLSRRKPKFGPATPSVTSREMRVEPSGTSAGVYSKFRREYSRLVGLVA